MEKMLRDMQGCKWMENGLKGSEPAKRAKEGE